MICIAVPKLLHVQLLVARLAESMLANGLPIDSAPLVSLPSFDPRTLLPQRSSLQSSAQPKHTGPLPAEPLATASDSDSRMTQDEEPDAEEEGDSVLEQKLREGAAYAAVVLLLCCWRRAELLLQCCASAELCSGIAIQLYKLKQ